MTISISILAALCSAALPAQTPLALNTGPYQPIPRTGAFFGLHFDLHPQSTDTELGKDTSEENIRALLDRVNPDFIQYDCKGHAGYCGFPSKAGYPSPGIAQDALAIWRKATKEKGVGLYVHYSGVWDAAALAHHPEWACLDATGKPDPNHTSVFGGYADGLLIPQLSEVIANYQIDGAWVDGECWAAKLDYTPASLAAWKAETGRADAPKDASDPDWLRWRTFNRAHFEKYVAHWVDALHAAFPGVQLTSNWMYSSMFPKPMEVKLDFLSGDYSPSLSVDRARFEARYLASQGMPWDLMAWGFNWRNGMPQNLKTPAQLRQEAAVVLMQGGGFQIYYNPTRAGYVAEEIISTSGEVADFCHARKDFSFRTASIPQAALVFPSETLWDVNQGVCVSQQSLEAIEGALHALLELGYPVDILREDQLAPKLDEYGLVVIAGAPKLPTAFIEAVNGYVTQGGGLLLFGDDTARQFESILGVTYDGAPASGTSTIQTSGGLVDVGGSWQAVRLTSAEPAAWRFATRDTRNPGMVAATRNQAGSGRVAAVYGPVSLAFYLIHHPAMRVLTGDLATWLFPTPTVKIAGPPCIDVALRSGTDGAILVHLLNTAGMQRAESELAMDFIPPVGPLTITLALPATPKSVTWEPGGQQVSWEWTGSAVVATIPSLEVHGVLVVKP